MKIRNKGIPYGRLSTVDQNMFFQKWRETGVILYKHEFDGWIIVNNPSWNNDHCYWCKDWDIDTGQKLEGKLCMVHDDEDGGEASACVIISQYDYAKDCYYETDGTTWDNATLVRLSEIENLIYIDCDVCKAVNKE